MNAPTSESEDILVTHEGNVRTFTIEGVTWKLRVFLTPQTVYLSDAETGVSFCEQPTEDLGIVYKHGKYSPSRKWREKLLTGFAIAWVMLRKMH
jgi:hypothetical protein